MIAWTIQPMLGQATDEALQLVRMSLLASRRIQAVLSSEIHLSRCPRLLSCCHGLLPKAAHAAEAARELQLRQRTQEPTSEPLANAGPRLPRLRAAPAGL